METLLELKWLFGHNQGNQGSHPPVPPAELAPGFTGFGALPAVDAPLCLGAETKSVPAQILLFSSQWFTLQSIFPSPKPLQPPKPTWAGGSTFSPEHEQRNGQPGTPRPWLPLWAWLPLLGSLFFGVLLMPSGYLKTEARQN